MHVQSNQLFLTKFKDKTNLLSKNGIIKIVSRLVEGANSFTSDGSNNKIFTKKLPSMSQANPVNQNKSNKHEIKLNISASKERLKPIQYNSKMKHKIVTGFNIQNQKGKTVDKLLPLQISKQKAKTQKDNQKTVTNNDQIESIGIDYVSPINSQLFLQRLLKTLDFDSLQALNSLDDFDNKLKSKNVSCHINDLIKVLTICQ